MIAGSVWSAVRLSIGYGTNVTIGGGVPHLLGVGAGVGLALGLAVGLAVCVALGVEVAVAVGVGNVTAAVLRSITSDDCGSVMVTSVPRPKITRLVSINSPAAFLSSCACWTSAMSGPLGSGRKP